MEEENKSIDEQRAEIERLDKERMQQQAEQAMREIREENAPKKKSKLPKILVILLIIVLLGVIVFLLNDKYEWIKLDKKESPKKTEEKKESKEVEEDIYTKYEFYLKRKSDDSDDKILYSKYNGVEKQLYSFKSSEYETMSDLLYNDKKVYFTYTIENDDKNTILGYYDLETKSIKKDYKRFSLQSNYELVGFIGDNLYYWYVSGNDVFYTYIVKYDMNTNKAQQLKKVKMTSRKGFGGPTASPSGVIYDNKLYIMLDDENKTTRSLHVIDENNNDEIIYTGDGTMAGGTHGSSSIVTAANGKIYLLEDNIKVYNPKTKKWSNLLDLDKDEVLLYPSTVINNLVYQDLFNGDLTIQPKEKLNNTKVIALTDKNRLFIIKDNKTRIITLKLSKEIIEANCYDEDDDSNRIKRACTEDDSKDWIYSVKFLSDNKLAIDLLPSGNYAELTINDKQNSYTITESNLVEQDY